MVSSKTCQLLLLLPTLNKWRSPYKLVWKKSFTISSSIEEPKDYVSSVELSGVLVISVLPLYPCILWKNCGSYNLMMKIPLQMKLLDSILILGKI
jgi:hypothetical protein